MLSWAWFIKCFQCCFGRFLEFELAHKFFSCLLSDFESVGDVLPNFSAHYTLLNLFHNLPCQVAWTSATTIVVLITFPFWEWEPREQLQVLTHVVLLVDLEGEPVMIINIWSSCWGYPWSLRQGACGCYVNTICAVSMFCLDVLPLSHVVQIWNIALWVWCGKAWGRGRRGWVWTWKKIQTH